MAKMRGIAASNLYLYGFFALVMTIGAFVLWLLPTWGGDGELAFIDALFTSVSAVAVTGLITANTAYFTQLGQVIILILIQLGGLGIIALSTIALTQPEKRISLQRRAIIRQYYIGSVEYRPRRIVRNIVLVTLGIELVIFLLLLPGFSASGTAAPVWAALFHAVSAFCNAGFSIFADSLETFAGNPAITGPVMLALVLGGLGFVVYQDFFRRAHRHRHVLSVHTRIVIVATITLIVSGFVVFLVTEWNNAFKDLSNGDKLFAALFQSVTPRTAGFNTVRQSELSAPGTTMTLFLMIIGGAPGSIAGGVKVTTVFIALFAAFGRIDQAGNERVFRRKIPADLVARANRFLIRAVLLLLFAFFMLTVTEILIAEKAFTFRELTFETFSAFGTVGLSLGITDQLSNYGKLIIILTMFAGRVSLISLPIPPRGKNWQASVDYPKGEVIIG